LTYIYSWEGSGQYTRGIDDDTGRTLVKIDPALYRVLDINRLQGDSSKAKKLLAWKYTRPFEVIQTVPLLSKNIHD
jgi:GDPmannose 4,6-dehydratase